MAVVKLTTTQVKDLVNDATKQTLGEEAIQTEDLSNVIDMGTAIANANLYENFIYNLLVATAKIIFVERKYTGMAPNVYRDNFEYGQLVQITSYLLQCFLYSLFNFSNSFLTSILFNLLIILT